MFETLGRIFETLGRMFQTFGRMFKTCGWKFKTFGRIIQKKLRLKCSAGSFKHSAERLQYPAARFKLNILVIDLQNSSLEMTSKFCRPEVTKHSVEYYNYPAGYSKYSAERLNVRPNILKCARYPAGHLKHSAECL